MLRLSVRQYTNEEKRIFPQGEFLEDSSQFYSSGVPGIAAVPSSKYNWLQGRMWNHLIPPDGRIEISYVEVSE